MERYIELLCRYQPEAVYNFLRANDNYRLEEALEVTHNYCTSVVIIYPSLLFCVPRLCIGVLEG